MEHYEIQPFVVVEIQVPKHPMDGDDFCPPVERVARKATIINLSANVVYVDFMPYDAA